MWRTIQRKKGGLKQGEGRKHLNEGKTTKINKGRNSAEKRVRLKLNCRLGDPLSSLFPSLFYLSQGKPRLSPFTCQCIYNGELSAPGCVGGEASSSLGQCWGLNLSGPDGSGWCWTARNRCVDLGNVTKCVHVCVSGWDHFSRTSRVAYLESTVLQPCPSLHLNAPNRSICLWDICTNGAAHRHR